MVVPSLAILAPTATAAPFFFVPLWEVWERWFFIAVFFTHFYS
jgi:hypothetical protein